MTTFQLRVLSTVRRIPPGRVATYGDVAEIAGRPGAARAVGNIMRNLGARDVPAHRVIAAAGRLGGYGGNTTLKRSLLQAEGIIVRGTRIKDFAAIRWAPRPVLGERRRAEGPVLSERRRVEGRTSRRRGT